MTIRLYVAREPSRSVQPKQTMRGLGYAALVAACALPAVLIGLQQTDKLLDDAFITYRYAENLASGHGFVFNAGERVLGTTAPLYGLLLAVLRLLGADLPQAGKLVGVAAWAAAAVLIALICATQGQKILGLIAGALVATCPLFLNAIGMETSLAVATSLGAFYLYSKGYYRAAFGLAAVATLLRPDCALVAMVLGLHSLAVRRTLPWREAVAYLLVVSPWLIWAQLYYGSFLPNTLFAKAGQGHKPGLGAVELGTFAKGAAALAAGAFSKDRLFLLAGVLALAGLVEGIRERRIWLLVVLWAMLYAAIYTILAVVPFPWYYPPLSPAWALLVGAGVVAVARLLGRLSRMPGVIEPLVMIVLALGVVLPQIRLASTYRVAEPTPYYRGYSTVADWLRTQTPPGSSVAAIEIGIIGYRSQRRIVDTMGLVSTDVTAHLDSWGQTVVYAINRYWPDYAVALEGTAWDGIVQSPWFSNTYDKAVTIPSAGPGSQRATIYRKRPGFPVQQFALTREVDLQAGPNIRLESVAVSPTVIQPPAIAVRQSAPPEPDRLAMQLRWRAGQATPGDYHVLVDLINVQTGLRRPLSDDQPMRGGNPTFLWRAGEVVDDEYLLGLPNDLPAGAYAVKIALQDAGTGQILPFTNQAGSAVSHVTAGPVWIRSGPPPGQPAQRLATFGNNIHLQAAEVVPKDVSPGDTVNVALTWTADQPISSDYTVFVHITDSQGNVVAQQDNPPAGGELPTSLWMPGVPVHDTYRIPLPASQPPGSLSVELGLYEFGSGARLPAHSAGLPVKAEAVELTRIAVR